MRGAAAFFSIRLSYRSQAEMCILVQVERREHIIKTELQFRSV